MTPKQEAALRLAADAIDEFCELGAIIRPLEVRDAIREALAEPKEKYQYGTPLLDAMTGKSEQPVNVAAVNTSSERVAKQAQNVHEQPAQQQEEPKRWAVFCSQCRKEWSVSYPHPGKSICAECDAKVEAQQQERVMWGVDWGRAGDQPCVSIIRRLPGGGIEVLATEYGPPTSKPLTDEQRKAIVVCFTSGKVSVSEVQRKLAISYNEAQQLCQSIVDLGLAQGLQLAPSLDRHGIKGDA